MNRTVTQEIAPLTVLTEPRALRHVPPEQWQQIEDPKVQRLLAAFELSPFDDDYSELEAELEALQPVSATTEPPARSVPPEIAHAMQSVVFAAGDLIQQSRMERALETWLGWNPAAFNPATKVATFAGGRARYRRSIASIPPTPATRELRQRLREAYDDLRDTPDAPSTRRAFARAVANLRDRLAATAHARVLRLLAADALPCEPAASAPATLTPANLAPPGGDDQTRALNRRAHLTVRPPVTRLTTTLALAPGAPSRSMCR